MAIGSNDVAAILGRQQISFGMSNAYAQQLSQMNPLQAFGARQMLPTGQMQQQMAGGQAAVGTIQGAATAGSFAMGGLGLAAAFGYAPRILDPFTSSINAARGGFAAGGMAGGIGMGLATMGGYLAIGAAASAVTDTFIRGASQQVHMQNSVMGNYGVSGMTMPMNMGAASQMANIGLNISDQMGAAGYGNIVNSGTMSNVISQGMAGGQFRGVGSLNEFRQKLQKVTAEAVMMSKLLKTSVENAQQQIQQMNQEFGFSGASAIGMTATMGRFAGATGMDMNTQLAAMQGGAQVMSSLGGTRASGAMMGLNQAAGISFQRDFGGVDSEFFATRGGAAGISSLYTRGSIGMLSGRGGRRLLSAMMTEEGELDERMASRIASGAVSREEITRMSRRRLGSAAGRRMFAMNQRELMGDFMGEFGATGAFRGLQAYSGSDEKGRFNMMVASGLDQQEFGSLERFAMSQGEITRRLNQAHQRGMGGPQKISVGQALSKYFDNLIAPIERKIEEAGRNAGAAVTGFANQFMGGLHGRGADVLPTFNFAHAGRMATGMFQAGIGGARFEHTYRPPAAIPGVTPGVEGVNAAAFGGGGLTDLPGMMTGVGDYVPGRGTYMGNTGGLGEMYTPGVNPNASGGTFFGGLGAMARDFLPRGATQLLEGRDPNDISFGMNSLLPSGRSFIGSALGMGDMSTGGIVAGLGGASYATRFIGSGIASGGMRLRNLFRSGASVFRGGSYGARAFMGTARAGMTAGGGLAAMRSGFVAGGFTGALGIGLENLGKRGMGYAAAQMSGRSFMGMMSGTGFRAGMAGLGGLTARGTGMLLGSRAMATLLGPVGLAATGLMAVEDLGEYGGIGKYTGPLATGRGIDNLKSLEDAGLESFFRGRGAIRTSRGGLSTRGGGYVPYRSTGGADGFFSTIGHSFDALFDSRDYDQYARDEGAQIDLVNPQILARALEDAQNSAATIRASLRDDAEVSTGTFNARIRAARDSTATVGMAIINDDDRAEARIGAFLDRLGANEERKRELMANPNDMAGLKLMMAGKDINLTAPTDFLNTESVKGYLLRLTQAAMTGIEDAPGKAINTHFDVAIAKEQKVVKEGTSTRTRTQRMYLGVELGGGQALYGPETTTTENVYTVKAAQAQAMIKTLNKKKAEALKSAGDAQEAIGKLLPKADAVIARMEAMPTGVLRQLAQNNETAVENFIAPLVKAGRDAYSNDAGNQKFFSATVDAMKSNLPAVAQGVLMTNQGKATAMLKKELTGGYAEATGKGVITSNMFAGTFAQGQIVAGLIDEQQAELKEIDFSEKGAVQNNLAEFGRKIRAAVRDADDKEEAIDIIDGLDRAGQSYPGSPYAAYAAQARAELRYKTAFSKELGAKASTPIHSLVRRRLAAGLLGGDRRARRLLGVEGSKEQKKYMTNYLKAHGHLPPETLEAIGALATDRAQRAGMGVVEAQKMASRITTGVNTAFSADPQSLASDDEFGEAVKDAGTMAIVANRGVPSPANKAAVGLTNFTKALETAETALKNFKPGGGDNKSPLTGETGKNP